MFSKIVADVVFTPKECRDYWTKETKTISTKENYFETVIMVIIAAYGLYILFKVVILKRFWDYFAILIPLLIVAYSIMTFCLYW
jgi:hypothetical protein